MKEKICFGVFRWTPTGVYRERDAVRVFHREWAAERFARVENDAHPWWGREEALVVRSIVSAAKE